MPKQSARLFIDSRRGLSVPSTHVQNEKLSLVHEQTKNTLEVMGSELLKRDYLKKGIGPLWGPVPFGISYSLIARTRLETKTCDNNPFLELNYPLTTA